MMRDLTEDFENQANLLQTRVSTATASTARSAVPVSDQAELKRLRGLISKKERLAIAVERISLEIERKVHFNRPQIRSLPELNPSDPFTGGTIEDDRGLRLCNSGISPYLYPHTALCIPFIVDTPSLKPQQSKPQPLAPNFHRPVTPSISIPLH